MQSLKGGALLFVKLLRLLPFHRATYFLLQCCSTAPIPSKKDGNDISRVCSVLCCVSHAVNCSALSSKENSPLVYLINFNKTLRLQPILHNYLFKPSVMAKPIFLAALYLAVAFMAFVAEAAAGGFALPPLPRGRP